MTSPDKGDSTARSSPVTARSSCPLAVTIGPVVSSSTENWASVTALF